MKSRYLVIMDVQSGKTFRRCLQHIPQESLLEVSRNGIEKELFSLLGYEFHSNVQYSMKKKRRWELPELISKDNYEEDQAVMYSKHQCLENCAPLLDLYLYDSLTNEEFGTLFVSNQKLESRNFNCNSVVKKIETRLDYTKKEKDSFEKLKSRGDRKRKISRKWHRRERVVTPQSEGTLPERDEFLAERATREKCLRLKEYVHVNNLSSVSKMAPIHGIRREISNADFMGLRRREKMFLRRMSEDESDDYDEDVEEKSEVDDEVKRPFLLRTEDFVCRDNPVSRKKRRKKRKDRWPSMVASVTMVDDGGWRPEEDTAVDLRQDALPSLSIVTSDAQFVEDVLELTEACRCSLGRSVPPVVAVDLDPLAEAASKRFLLLRPAMERDGAVTVTATFNIGDCDPIDFADILDRDFHDVRSLVAFVQSTRLTCSASSRYSAGRKVIMLDGKVNGMPNLWKTKETDLLNPLYLYHKEWESQEITEQSLTKICGFDPQQARECSVCFCDDVDMIVMESCGHSVCQNCLSSHIVYRLETGMQEMICPGTDCDSTIDASTILSLVSWRRYCKRLGILEASLISQGGCPCSLCGAVLVDSCQQWKGARKRLEYKCVCENVICSRCGRTQHWPSTCLEMIRHKQKMAELNDLKVFSLKIKPLIFSGRSCPNCFVFVVKNVGCNHLTCNCGTHFCWGCGEGMTSSRHLSTSFPCARVSDLIRQDMTQYSLLPDPSSLRPRLYCTALYHHINNNNYDSVQFYRRLKTILYSHCSTYDAGSIIAQISELSVVIESIFVKSYQIDKRQQASVLRLMKSRAALFIFYQTRIKAIVDVIQSHTVRSKWKTYGKKSITEYSQKLALLAQEAQDHLNRFYQLFDH